MKNLKDIVLEKLKITKETNDFDTLYNLLEKIERVNLGKCFSGNKEELYETHSGGSVYYMEINKRKNTLEIWCASKTGEISDIVTVENNSELYNFLSSTLVNCTAKEYINIVVDYLRSIA